MKSILISIKPKWVAKILNGEKTIEIRKTAPKCELPIDVYIYCTKGGGLIYDGDAFEPRYRSGKYSLCSDEKQCLEGKTVAKFTLRKVEKLKIYVGSYIPVAILHTNSIPTCSLMEKESCLTMDEIWKYTKMKGYAWHISDLQLLDNLMKPSGFDNLMELSDFGLKRAPQSWCYVEKTI